MPIFSDARSADLPPLIEGSVCIIGAGAAGITLARTLGHQMDGVILVESGGFDIDGETQELFAGNQLGLPYFNLLSCRLRYFGGTTNHWSGYCRVNDPVDYEGRPELGLPKWPVTHDDLAPYIKEAAQSLGIGSADFNPQSILQSRNLDGSDLAEQGSDILLTKAFLFARRKRLGQIYRDELQTIDRLQGLLNLNLVNIQLNAAGTQVEEFLCRTLDGKSVRIKAQAYAICCHAIENARLLLDSNDILPKGVGNAHDHVGRYFMDHIHLRASRLIPSEAFPLLYDRSYAARHGANINLSFTDDFTRQARLLQYYCRFNPGYIDKDTESAFERMSRDALEPGSLQYLRDIARVTSRLVPSVKYALWRKGRYEGPANFYDMEHRLEQAPNPDSRVVLSDRRDALGSRIADLDWRLSDVDIDSLRTGQEKVSTELAAMGWGRVEEEEITREMVESRVKGHYHQIGTTRMSASPEDGVVNRDCQVHGIDNLYIAGSSIFPTAGYSGPTMMIIALALRLAEHLRTRRSP